MRKMESEVEWGQGPAQGGMSDCDDHSPAMEAEMIMMHGSMGPSQGEMDKDMSQSMGPKMGATKPDKAMPMSMPSTGGKK